MTSVLMTSLAAFAKKLGWTHPRRTVTGEQPVREPLSRPEIERELRLSPGERWSGASPGPRPATSSPAAGDTSTELT